MIQPSPNGLNGCERNARGHFTKGNAGGPGNPFARRTAEIRALIRDTVTDDDLRAIIASLIERAKAGDLQATREIFDRCIGRSPQGLYQANESGEAINSRSFADPDQEIMELLTQLGLDQLIPPAWKETPTVACVSPPQLSTDATTG